jgi:hypothetical protein
MADHRRDDDRGHDNRRLRRPFAGNRISRRLGAAARVPDGLACGLAMVGRHGLGQHDHHAEGRNVLLGHDSVFSDARHGAWRLGRRYEQSRLWRRRNPVRWGARRHSRALCLHTDVACDLFWAAFILTRPLGATLGDLLDKPLANGGFAISRYLASAILAGLIVTLIAVLPKRAGVHPGAHGQEA